MFGFGAGTMFLIIVIVMFLWSAIKILPEYERGVVFFLGRFQAVKGPGIVLLVPGVQKMIKISLRTVTLDVPPQGPDRAVISVENYLYATSQLAQTTLRSVCGQAELDELLAEREKINIKIQEILDRQTDPWGIKVALVEVKGIDLPEAMQRAMAKQAEAEREKRAKIIHAAGEFEASQKVLEASNILSQNPIALQLRYLQTLTEIAAEKNSTIVFPLPIEIIKPFLEAYKQK